MCKPVSHLTCQLTVISIPFTCSASCDLIGSAASALDLANSSLFRRGSISLRSARMQTSLENNIRNSNYCQIYEYILCIQREAVCSAGWKAGHHIVLYKYLDGRKLQKICAQNKMCCIPRGRGGGGTPLTLHRLGKQEFRKRPGS